MKKSAEICDISLGKWREHNFPTKGGKIAKAVLGFPFFGSIFNYSKMVKCPECPEWSISL